MNNRSHQAIPASMMSSLKPAYFPMSDTEDNDLPAASEPYSSEYHQKMAKRTKPSIMDAVHDDTAIDAYDAPTTSRSGEASQPIMMISSVRSLNTQSSGPPPPDNSSSVSDSHESAVWLQHPRQVFGIAKVTETRSTHNKKSPATAANANLLKDVTKSDSRRGRGPAKAYKPPQTVSKIGKLRKAFDHVYKGRIHPSQGSTPVMDRRRRRMASNKVSEVVAAAAKSTDDDDDDEEDNSDEEENNGENDDDSPFDSSPNDDSSRSSAPSKSSTTRGKVIPAAVASLPAPTLLPAMSGSAATGRSRRKTAHKPIANDDDDIIFVDVGGTVVTVAPRSSIPSNAEPLTDGRVASPAPFQPQPMSPRSLELQGVRAIENPNADLIKKVAFLRCCVNYMMIKLNRKPYSFHRYSNLGYLAGRYKQNKNPNGAENYK